MVLFDSPRAASTAISRSRAVSGSGRTAIARAGVRAPDLEHPAAGRVGGYRPGIAAATSPRLTGLSRLAPLLVGLYFPLQLVIQLIFLLEGRDGAHGPNGALLGTWGLLWAGAALASLTAKRRDGR